MKQELSNGKLVQPLKENKNIRFSLSRGLKFDFRDGDTVISFWLSILTGKEKVLIGDEVVSEKRTFWKSSTHSFQYMGNNYVIEFNAKSHFKYSCTCTLTKNGALIRESQLIDTQNGKPFYKKDPEIILGASIGFAFATGWISLPAAAVLFVLAFPFMLWYSTRFIHTQETSLV